MIKIFKIIIGIVLILALVLCGSLYVFVKTMNVDRYRAGISRVISNMTGRLVMFDAINLSFVPIKTIALNVDGIKVIDPEVGFNEPVVKLKKLTINIDALAFLLENKILLS